MKSRSGTGHRRETPISLAELLPHRPPALLLRGLYDRPDDDSVVCRAALPAALAEAADSSSAAPVLAVEMGAQAAGVLAALRAREGRGGAVEPSSGYLVAIQEATFATDALPLEVEVLAEVRILGETGPMSRFAFVVRGLGEAGVEYARGTLATFAREVSGSTGDA